MILISSPFIIRVPFSNYWVRQVGPMIKRAKGYSEASLVSPERNYAVLTKEKHLLKTSPNPPSTWDSQGLNSNALQSARRVLPHSFV